MKTSQVLVFVLIYSLTLSSCVTRFLTNDEKDYTSSLFSIGLDLEKIEIKIGNEEVYKKILKIQEEIIKENNNKTIVGKGIPKKNNVEAITIDNTIYFLNSNYHSNFLYKFPNEINLESITLFSHEVFHVWQYQNKNDTGYSLPKVISEHLFYKDPYYYDIDEINNNSPKILLDYRFEQQARIFQDFIYLYIVVKILNIQNIELNRQYQKYYDKIASAGINPKKLADKVIKMDESRYQ